MGGILNTASRALQANQTVLTTIGNNISNVNTPGYSRQQVSLEAVQGQFTGGGYIGKGVSVETIRRNVNDFLVKQSAIAGAIYSADNMRSDRLNQLQELFPGGADGLGAAINAMMNSFSDVATAPTDLTARQVTLTRIDETATRLRQASQNLDNLVTGVRQDVAQKIASINTITTNIAATNDEIARAFASGQPPNDLLDRREQLVRDLNQYVQTSQVPASDGTLSLFIGGSQALVLGTTAATLSLTTDDYNDLLGGKLAITRGGATVSMDEQALGGGEVPALLRYMNTDLNSARSQLGRISIAMTDSINAQHQLGLDLSGNPGGNVFTATSFGANNVLTPQAPATVNAGTATMALSVNSDSQLLPSDYEITFSGANTYSILRRSDNSVRQVNFTTPTNYTVTQIPGGTPVAYTASSSDTAVLDGLNISFTAGAVAGDRFLLKPYSTSASNIQAQFSSPAALAVTSPIAAKANPANTGSLALSKLVATGNATTLDNYQINFSITGAGVSQYTVVDTTTATTVVPATNFVPGQAITYTPTGGPGFSITLTGAAKAGDQFLVQKNPYPNLDGGNATAMMDIRDQAMFDGAPFSDGYANMLADLGTRAQSAQSAAKVSQTIANNLEKDRTSVSGVNLDEEAAQMLQYQQAYQASAKVVQVAQSMFDTLVQNLFH